MRILAWPASAKTNNHMDLLYSSMAHLGLQVDDFSEEAAAAGRVDFAPYDLLHIHWPDNHFNARNPLKILKGNANVLSWLEAAQAAGVKLVWTAHNLRPHERYHPYLEPLFYRPFTRMLDGWITLSETAEEEARARYPHLRDTPTFVIPRGHYRDSHRVQTTREAARAQLGLSQSAQVILNFGQIRPYKNVPHLIRTFRKLEGADKVLIVAGRLRAPRLEPDIRAAAEGDSRVRLELRHIPDEDLPTYFAAADLAVLPYKDILHSGSALMALSLDTPVLVPDLGAMDELQARTGRAWVRMYEGTLGPHDLQDALSWAQAVTGQRADLSALAWDRVGEETWRAFQEVLGRAPTQVHQGAPAQV